jgi:hypothetical protein
MKQKTKPKVTNKDIEKAVEGSSNLEGLSLNRARKNKKVLKKIKEHGRDIRV